jgi:hypothetical protein
VTHGGLLRAREAASGRRARASSETSVTPPRGRNERRERRWHVKFRDRTCAGPRPRRREESPERTASRREAVARLSLERDGVRA